MLLDTCLVLTMLVSGVLALVRGLAREILSIAGWVAAAGAGFLAYYKLVPFTKAYFNTWSDLAVAIGTVAVAFVLTLIVVAVMTVRISDKILDSKIGALDRTLGFVYGLGRGLIVVVVAFAFYDWFQPKSPPMIADARSITVLRLLRDEIIGMAPDIEAWYSKYKKRDNAGEPPA
jgi:membrane protein required for colicin V production